MKRKTKKKIKKKKVRIKFGFFFSFLLCILLSVLCINKLLNLSITNIYISGNRYLSDQQIIELAKIQDYPSTFKNYSSKIEKRLKQNAYIKDAKVSKKSFTQVFITIEENRPLFYNSSIGKIILIDKSYTTDKFNVPILVNIIPDAMYEELIKKMAIIEVDVLNKISEIKYAPDEVDAQRFLFTMTDSNYVYLTLNKLEKINNYNEIVKQFDNKKGILYLNSGGYFEIFE